MICKFEPGVLWECKFFLVILHVSERKLASGEFPHNLYIQNYSTSSATCITLRRWLFSPAKEKQLLEDAIALDFFFWQVSTPALHTYIQMAHSHIRIYCLGMGSCPENGYSSYLETGICPHFCAV